MPRAIRSGKKIAGVYVNYDDFDRADRRALQALNGGLAAKDAGYVVTSTPEYLGQDTAMGYSAQHTQDAQNVNRRRMQPDMPFERPQQRDDLQPARRPRPGF